MKNIYVVKGFVENGAFKEVPFADEAGDYLNACAVWKSEGYEGYEDVSKDVESCPDIQYALDFTNKYGQRFVSLAIVAESEDEAEKIAINLSDNGEI